MRTMLFLWLYLGLFFVAETAGAVPSFAAVLQLTKDGLQTAFEETGKPARGAATAVLSTHDVIGAYLLDPDFPLVMAELGLTFIALFAVKKFHTQRSRSVTQRFLAPF